MVKQATLLSELQSIAGKKYVREPKDSHDCAVDGLSPKAVAEPGTYAEVAEVLRFANTERLAVIPRGEGRQTGLGNIPDRYDIALSLARFNKIVEHEPADLTVTCQAGITVGALGRHLSASGQIVPLALGLDQEDRRTVGGLLSLNLSDFRAAYGGPRDFTIGLRVLTADGRMSRTGGKVVKNVAGYDLCKIYIGSRGTLVVIAEATFKLFPRPETQETVSFEFVGCLEACRAASELHARGLNVADARVVRPPAATENDTETPSYVLNLAFAGEPRAVERSLQEARTLAAQKGAGAFEWTRQRGAWAPSGGQVTAEPLSARALLLPTRVPEFVRMVEDEADMFIEVAPLLGSVLCVVFGPVDQVQVLERLRATAHALGGNLVVEVCPPEPKRRIDVFGPPPPSFPLMRAVKQQFDPNNILSPGRFVGRL